MQTNKKSKIFYYFIFIGNIILWFLADFLSKRWAISQNFNSYQWLEGFFYLIPFQKNEGIAFSIPVPSILQIVATVIILFFLTKFGLKYIFENKIFTVWRCMFLGMALGGGLGNLIDRIFQGYVVDFIVLGPIPVFNLADVGITVGLMGLFATMLLEPKTNIKK